MIFTDRWFMSLDLVESLLRAHTFVIGTMKQQMGFPDQASISTPEERVLDRGQSKVAVNRSKNIKAICWKDSKLVFLLSSVPGLNAVKSSRFRVLPKFFTSTIRWAVRISLGKKIKVYLAAAWSEASLASAPLGLSRHLCNS